MHIVFLLEEYSAKVFLDAFLPRIIPAEHSFLTVAHQGKSELQKSIPRKLRGWRTPDTKFVILHDQDSVECLALKNQLMALCEKGRQPALIRIACRTLEAWYLGDLEAFEKCYPGSKASKQSRKSRFRHPDTIHRPFEELSKIAPEFQKVDGARRMASCISEHGGNSPSFRTFVSGVRDLVAA